MTEALKPAVVGVQIGKCSITFSMGRPPIPRSEVVDGNVTIINNASPATPSYFLAEFMITTATETIGVRDEFPMMMRFVIPRDNNGASFREILIEAVQQIAPTLRSVADQIDQQLDEFDLAGSEEVVD